MPRSIATRTTICSLLLLFTAGLAQAQAPEARRTAPDLLRELAELRLEVLQQGIDVQMLKIGHLQRDLLEVRGAEQRLAEPARQINEHMTAINGSSIGQPERAQELESARANLIGGLSKVKSSQREATSRAIEVETQINQEQQRLAYLAQRAEKLKIENRDLSAGHN